MKSACHTWLNPIDGDGHAAQVTERPFDRGKVSYLRGSLQFDHLQVVSGSGSHSRGLIRARLRIRSSCDLLPIRRRAPASYERATVSRFGAPRHLTRSGNRTQHDFRIRTRPERRKPLQTHSSLSVRHRYSRMARVACWLLRRVANLAEQLL